MIKLLKNKLVISFMAVAVIVVVAVGISTKTFLTFYNAHITNRKSQAFDTNEDYMENVIINSQNSNENNDEKELNKISDEEILNDNSQNNDVNINSQKTIGSKMENLYNNDINNQKTISSKSEILCNNNDTNKQTTTSSQIKDTNSNINTENKGSTNDIIKTKKPTIHYDRTTSIYANDNITLLRIEYYINNKLTYYSVIEQFDVTTKSYIEKIYKCNRETNIDPLIRTDVYVNGNLINSY